MIMRQPILYVCAYDASLDFDTPYIYVFSTYARALRHACDEIRDRLVDEASLELADEIGALLNEGRLDETLEAYADGSEPGRYVIIEERLVDPEAIEHDHDPPNPVVTVTPVPKPYAAPSLKRIEPTEAIRAAFGPPQTTDVEVRAELLTAARAILAEHAAARQLGRADALHHCHEAAMQLTIAIRDYLENAP